MELAAKCFNDFVRDHSEDKESLPSTLENSMSKINLLGYEDVLEMQVLTERRIQTQKAYVDALREMRGDFFFVAKELYGSLKDHEEVVGYSITERTIVIMIAKPTEFTNKIPSEYKSYPVITEVTGEFHLQ
jgi:hypothetical protein